MSFPSSPSAEHPVEGASPKPEQQANEQEQNNQPSAEVDLQVQHQEASAVPAYPPPQAPMQSVLQPYPPNQPMPVQNGPAGMSGPVSLYVGELDPGVTEAMLFEIFNMIGPVASVRVCRDAVTRRSLGYAYVNYLNFSDGERALDQLNYSAIKNRPCRIMWSQRDPGLRKTGQGNIFIKNLDQGIDNKALHDTFAAFGNVLSCKVAIDENGGSKGYGFVHYETAEAADAAIKSVNGMLLNDKKVFVGHHISRKERQSKIDEMKSHFTNLYVKNLDLEVTQQDFEQLFSQYGSVTSAVVQVDDEGKSKGFGFVNFDNHEDAQRAVDELNNTDFHGKQLFVSRAQKKSEREDELRKQYEQAKYEKAGKYQGVNLYIKNLDDDMDDDKLRSEFENYGSITSCKIMRDEKGASKGFGFVCFSSPDEATRAISEMNNKILGSKPLYVALAQRRDVRRQQLESQIAQRNNQMRMAVAQGLTGLPYGAGPQMYYGPPGAAYPPQGQRALMGYPQPGIMPRTRYTPGQQMPGMPVPAPYGQGPPQAYGVPAAYGRARPPRQPGVPMAANAPGAPRGPGAATVTGANGTARPPIGGLGGPPVTGPSAGRGVPAANGGPVNAPQTSGYKLNPSTRNAGPTGAMPPEGTLFNPNVVPNVSQMEQKQMLGEVIYMKIYALQPDLAGKITGMLLEMENAELVHLLEVPEALAGKVSEAMIVLDEFAKVEQQQQS